MGWNKKMFDDLTKRELYTILRIRTQVFVVEQNCPYEEVDGRDEECTHIWKEDNGDIVAYCRIVPPEKPDEYYSIGRVLVTQEARGKGYGRKLMNTALMTLYEWEVSAVQLHGQEYLRDFYRSFGFEEVTDVYLEDNIPHVDMVLKMPPAR
ncbi:GNAT family N-acetyltransferase [Halobacillus massiliensis]|uniref:GNAT family N-acetyltransferase n=1 Tax=Halobacillus massiliensis TaxID=1926286 RepID=UPI0015C4129A|nr:GNAT family N-acetyltransferase [Halobacillus massiliensis]